MCIFRLPVGSVTNTRIFVCRCGDNQQLTIYQNHVTLPGVGVKRKGGGEQPSNAMILPLPIDVERLQDVDEMAGVKLLDLTKAAAFFRTLNAAFPEPAPTKSRARATLGYGGKPLTVHRVGSYLVSVAPTLAALRRVDQERLPLPADLSSLVAMHYAVGFAFAVCKFDSNVGDEQHPLGFVHAAAPRGRLYAPTRHCHGGDDDHADWDHRIFSCDTVGGEAATMADEEEAEEEEEWEGAGEAPSKPFDDGSPATAAAAVVDATLRAALPDDVTASLPSFKRLHRRRLLHAAGGVNRDVYFKLSEK